MGLNIKNADAEEKIRELATLRGVSLVTAISDAVDHEIQREKEAQRKKKLMAEWLMKISRETGPMMQDGKTSVDLINELYDPETGLPI
ncbi:MAG TPA: type II toxin-antitoxin system VapB family antitoxin [Terracidiphilus sp.]|nr:type II toxin-antitoxin system VapB family antitoxin [Terracidiphilus sp.]